MTTETNAPSSFAYRAQTRDGQAISGTIDAITIDDATHRLQSLQLAGVEVEPAPRPRPKALRGDDFLAFNEQLAQLTGAGLPVEQGLRLVAADMRRGRMRRTLDLVAADLESGKTLPQAIDAHRDQFPPLYSRLVDAGIRAGNLPRVLLNLGRHLALVRRLQAMLWRTFSYPVLVICAMAALFTFLFVKVLPQFQDTFDSYGTQLPTLTVAVMSISAFLAHGGIWIALAAIAALIAVFVLFVWLAGRSRVVAENLLLPIPCLGPILRRNLISRWCDAVGLGIESGIDLPAAIAMADDAIGSPALHRDGQAIISTLESGQPIAQSPPGKILPPMVVAAIDLSAAHNDLPQGLRTLSEMYERQAEKQRLASVETMLTPLVIVFMGAMIAVLIIAMFAPFIGLIQVISNPWHHKYS